MRLLVTGGCGFVGHHVVEGVLRETDWDVTILDGLNYAASTHRLEDISCWPDVRHRVRFVWHDLRAPITAQVHERLGRIDFVWHLAAESHVERSLVDALPFVASNVLGTAHLLEYLRANHPSLEGYIQFSTDEVYGPAAEGVFHKEGAPLWPSNPYSASKAGADCLAFAFAHAHRMPIAITRTMNVFGERQDREKFVPMLVRRLLSGEKVTLHGDGGRQMSSRCWIHGRNVASALMFLTPRIEREGIYHIVGEERSVYTLAQAASVMIHGRGLEAGEYEVVNWHSSRPGHDLRYALDGSKLRGMGWQPGLSTDESFARCVRWMIQTENLHWLGLQPAEARV